MTDSLMKDGGHPGTETGVLAAESVNQPRITESASDSYPAGG